MKKYINTLLIMALLPIVAFATDGKVNLKNTCPGSLFAIYLFSSDGTDTDGEFGAVDAFVNGQSHTFDTPRDIDMVITGVLEPNSTPLDNIRPGEDLEIYENHEGHVTILGIDFFTRICRIRKI